MAVAAGSDGPADSPGGGQHCPGCHNVEQPVIERYFLVRWARVFVPIVQRRAWKRLRSTLAAYRQELAGRKVDGTDFTKVEQALNCAERSLADGDIDGGWKCFMAAQRLALFTYSDRELAAVATMMRAEADKLGSWRKTAVLDLLKDDQLDAVLKLLKEFGNTEAVLNFLKARSDADAAPKPSGPAANPDPRQVRVFHAALLRDEHYHNEAYRNGLRRSSALWIALALIGGLLMLFWLACNDALLETLQDPRMLDPTNEVWTLLTVGLFGFLGATFSAAISMPAANVPTRIPELVSSFRVTLLRLLVGPVSAIVIFLAVQSAAYSFLFAKTPDGAAILIIAFVAGFTERLVARVVEAVAGRSSS